MQTKMYANRPLHLSHGTHAVLPAAHHVEVCKVSSGVGSHGLPWLQYITSSFLNHPCDENYFMVFDLISGTFQHSCKFLPQPSQQLPYSPH